MTLVRCCHVQIWVEEVTKTIYNRAFEKNHLHAIVVWRLYFKLLPFVNFFFLFLVLVFSISCSKVSLTLWLIAAEATFWYFHVATPLSRGYLVISEECEVLQREKMEVNCGDWIPPRLIYGQTTTLASLSQIDHF